MVFLFDIFVLIIIVRGCQGTEHFGRVRHGVQQVVVQPRREARELLIECLDKIVYSPRKGRLHQRARQVVSACLEGGDQCLDPVNLLTSLGCKLFYFNVSAEGSQVVTKGGFYICLEAKRLYTQPELRAAVRANILPLAGHLCHTGNQIMRREAVIYAVQQVPRLAVVSLTLHNTRGVVRLLPD